MQINTLGPFGPVSRLTLGGGGIGQVSLRRRAVTGHHRRPSEEQGHRPAPGGTGGGEPVGPVEEGLAELSGRSGLMYLRDGQSGKVVARQRVGAWGQLNADLHQN